MFFFHLLYFLLLKKLTPEIDGDADDPEDAHDDKDDGDAE